MKNLTRILAIVMTFALIISCAACNAIDINKIKGNWTLDSVNGSSLAEAAATNGIAEYQQACNLTITDTEITSATYAASQTFTFEKGADGIQVKQDGQVIMAYAYDAAADTLTSKVDTGSNVVTFVYKKGTYDIEGAKAAAEAPAEEDYSGEDYGEEEYYEE